MHVILFLLFISTITKNGSANQIFQNLQEKPQNVLPYFSSDNSEKIRSVREVSNYQYQSSTSVTDIVGNIIQYRDRKRKKRASVLPLENNMDSEKFLEKRFSAKNVHHKRNQKRAKTKRLRGRKNSLRKRSRRKKWRNEMANFSSKKRLKNQNRPYSKKNSKLIRHKMKRFSPHHSDIDFSKNDRHSRTSENCGNSKNCQNSLNYLNEYFRAKNQHRRKHQIKRSPENLRQGESINRRRNCEATCRNKNFNSDPCVCKNDKPIDFERQLKILNKGGEEIETKKEEPGILRGIQNFIKVSLKQETTLNPYQCQSSDSTTTSASDILINNNNIFGKNDTNFLNNTEITSEAGFKTSEAMTEVTGEDIGEPVSEDNRGIIEGNNGPTTEDNKEIIQGYNEPTTEDNKEIIDEDNEPFTEAIGKTPCEDNYESTSEVFNEATFEDTNETFGDFNEDNNKPSNVATDEATNEAIFQSTKGFTVENKNEAFTKDTRTFTEVTNQVNLETTISPATLSTGEISSRTTNFNNEDRTVDCENDSEAFGLIEDVDSFRKTEISAFTSTEKDAVESTPLCDFENNSCLFTTSAPYDPNEPCKNNAETNIDSSDDKKYKKPIATFSLEFKSNPKAKKKGFRFKMKY